MQQNVELKTYNTFGLAAKALCFETIYQKEQVKALVQNGELIEPVFVLGGGSNILFTRDYAGTILKNEIRHFEVLTEDTEQVLLRLGGGNNWHQTVMKCVENGWGGIENLSLIPGTVGAAPIQNIGAYGCEIKDVLKTVHTIHLHTGEEKEYNAIDCKFGYRDSIFKRELKGKIFISYVDIMLTKNREVQVGYGDIKSKLEEMGVIHASIADVSSAIIAIRQSKLPNPEVLGNCGSFFKNPVISVEQFQKLKETYPEIKYFEVEDGIKIPAGWLIEHSGLKGKRIGNVGMHEKQALVLVNYGNASGQELLTHAQLVQNTVYEKYGILLEMEVNVW